MSSLHKIFEELPSHRADYKNITESTDKDSPTCLQGIDGWKTSQLLKKLWKYGQRSFKLLNIGNHCQKGYDKAGNNTSYDHLVTSIDDPLIPGKIMIFEELANKMNKLLTLF